MECSKCLFWNVVLIQIMFSKSESGECLKRTESGTLLNVCCADHEQVNGSCEPCKVGYTSEIGQFCKPCPINTFGHLCLGGCLCNNLQRCDHIVGCVAKRQILFSHISKQTIEYTKPGYTQVCTYSAGERKIYLFSLRNWLEKLTRGLL